MDIGIYTLKILRRFIINNAKYAAPNAMYNEDALIIRLRPLCVQNNKNCF